MRRAALLFLLCLAPAAQARPAPDAAPLARAIEASDLGAAQAALATPGLANAVLPYGETPLARAVETQNAEMVALLLAKGAKPRGADSLGRSPLSLACELGADRIVGQLLDAGAEVRKGALDGTTPLAVCARFAGAASVTRMLAMGADADAVDTLGQTPLMWAASAGKTDTVALLLEAGADVNRVTPGRFTPLFFAIRSGSAQATKALLDAGADAAHLGPEDTTALQLALYQENWGAAALLVARGGFDLAALDRNGNRPLHVAAAAGEIALVAILLDHGAEANGLTGPSRVTWVTEANFGMPPPPVPPTPPLLLAAHEGRVETMRLLVARGADSRFVAANGINVVLAAASGRSAASLEEALALVPDANVADANGRTPLHLALATGPHDELEAMLAVLARHGARPDQPDARGSTPNAMAREGLTEVKVVFDRVFGQTPSTAPAASHQ